VLEKEVVVKSRKQPKHVNLEAIREVFSMGKKQKKEDIYYE
jgi:hypothetical protein